MGKPLEHFAMLRSRLRGLKVKLDQSTASFPVRRTIAAPATDSTIGEFNALPVTMIIVDVIMSAENTDDAVRRRKILESLTGVAIEADVFSFFADRLTGLEEFMILP